MRKPEELESLLTADRFEVINHTDVLVNHLSRQMRLNRFTGINYMLTAV